MNSAAEHQLLRPPMSRHGSGPSQQIFRTLLSALSQPGEIHALPSSPLETRLPMAVWPLLALAHHGIGVGVVDEPAWQNHVCALTGAQSAPISDAALVVSMNGLSAGTVQALRHGTVGHPESAAQVFAGCGWLDGSPRGAASGLRLRLTGPGIAGSSNVGVGGLDAATVAARNESCRDFPAGFDLWLIDTSGRVCGIPRSTTVTVVSSEAGDDLDC